MSVMSSEHDKDSISLKRSRGGDGGLDGLGGPGVQLGSPDKRKRKASVQGSSFPPLSEYAPPPNPSGDHLIAANPFDDNYSTISYKPLPSGNPYFSNPNYPGFGGYNSFRMPPHMQPRMSSPYGGPYSIRNQPHPFPQTPVGMGFNRAHGFGFGPHDGSNFGPQPMYNSVMNQNVNMPQCQPFRPNSGENFNQVSQQNVDQNCNPDMAPNFGPGNNANFSPQVSGNMDSSHPFVQQNNYNQTNASNPKPDFGQGMNKSSPHAATHQHHPDSEETIRRSNADLKNTNRSKPISQENNDSSNPENINGSHGNGSQNNSNPLRNTSDGSSSEKHAKTSVNPIHSGRTTADPVYPCGICMNEVNDDQDAILCEASCQKWFHRICTGMTETAYGFLTAEVEAVWGCDTCMAVKDVQLMRTREPVVHPTLNRDG